ncbi:hypothetical protein [Streptomyces bauhiniae]|uniref:hypothetical protein n=1 Tax=Streptomyces bauhiniae TaxID=2340725 RepID=UPI0035D83F11
MTEKFIVNPDGLKNASVPLVALAERIRSAANGVAARISADGNRPWGSGKAGRQFAEGYVPVARDLIEALSGIYDVLDSSAVKLNTMGKGFSNANEGAMEATARLNGQLDGHQGRGGSGGGRGGRG